MTRPIDTALLKLEWAQQHLGLLQNEIGAFAKTDHRLWTYREIEAETGRDVLRVTVLPDPPVRIGMIFQDVIHNARAALDYAVFRPNAKGLPRSSFPVFTVGRSRGRNKRTYAKVGVKSIQHLSRPAQKFIESVQPYHRLSWHGPTNPLARLHDLDVAEKHHGVPLIARGGQRRYSEVFAPSGKDVPEGVSAGPAEFDNGDIAAVLWSPENPDIHFEPSLTLKVFLPEDGPRRWELGPLAASLVSNAAAILGNLRRLL